MGSGSRFKVIRMEAYTFALGVVFTRFPFAFTVDILLIKWSVMIGFGKGYDE